MESTPLGETEAVPEMSAEQPAPGEAGAPHDPNAPTATSKTKAKQETLQFEPTTRGRFDKSEPTIVEGEDLDVPTFLRVRKPD
jgi:cell division protein FtsZ